MSSLIRSTLRPTIFFSSSPQFARTQITNQQSLFPIYKRYVSTEAETKPKAEHADKSKETLLNERISKLEAKLNKSNKLFLLFGLAAIVTAITGYKIHCDKDEEYQYKIWRLQSQAQISAFEIYQIQNELAHLGHDRTKIPSITFQEYSANYLHDPDEHHHPHFPCFECPVDD